MNTLENCTVCPRNCGTNRIQGALGFCRANSKVKIARVPFIIGKNLVYQELMAQGPYSFRTVI